MALKFRIKKADYDALSADVKKEYRTEGDDYVLDVEGNGDADALRRAKDREAENARREKERADEAERKLAEAEREKAAREDEANRKKGDVTAIEKSWSEKLEKEKADRQADNERHKTQIDRLLKNGRADAIASEICTVPGLLAPVIAARLSVEHSSDANGEPLLRVLDADGKPSAMSVEDLKKELVAKPEYAAIIVGSKASGGGAGNSRPGGGAAPKKISEMTEAERVALHRENPQEFARLRAAEQAGAQT